MTTQINQQPWEVIVKGTSEQVHEVEPGDTLADLAERYYGMRNEFPRIIAANHLSGLDSDQDLSALGVGPSLMIPGMPAGPSIAQQARGKYQQLVRGEAAALEGRELLKRSVMTLQGVSPRAVNALQAIGVRSIFDLALARTFNGVHDLAERSGVLASKYTQHGLIPGDLVLGDPARIQSLHAFLDSGIDALHFGRATDAENREIARELSEALALSTVRDLALWPPFQAARRIVRGTFNAHAVREDDSDTPADLVPQTGNYATERVQYASVIMTEMTTPEAITRELESESPVSLLGGIADAAGATAPAEGARITTEQAWYAQGVTLGQLLHSVALGPGESTRIAMIDWTRRTSGRTRSATSELDRLSQSSAQARSISEITNAIARESQHGSSVSQAYASSMGMGRSASTGGSLGFFGTGASGSTSTNMSMGLNRNVATSVSRTSGERRISAHTAQRVTAQTRQQATSARSRRATIVQETFEKETQVANTRVITNYNHMHALTLQYYEVVQTYRVRTKVIDYERVLFVPMNVVNFRDPSAIEKHRDILWRYAPFVDRQPEESTTLKAIKDALDSGESLVPNEVEGKRNADVIAMQLVSEALRRRQETPIQQLITRWTPPRFSARLKDITKRSSTFVTQQSNTEEGATGHDPFTTALSDAWLHRIDYSVEVADGSAVPKGNDPTVDLRGIQITSRAGRDEGITRLFSGAKRRGGREVFANLRLADVDEIRLLRPAHPGYRSAVTVTLYLSGHSPKDDAVDLEMTVTLEAPGRPDVVKLEQERAEASTRFWQVVAIEGPVEDATERLGWDRLWGFAGQDGVSGGDNQPWAASEVRAADEAAEHALEAGLALYRDHIMETNGSGVYDGQWSRTAALNSIGKLRSDAEDLKAAREGLLRGVARGRAPGSGTPTVRTTTIERHRTLWALRRLEAEVEWYDQLQAARDSPDHAEPVVSVYARDVTDGTDRENADKLMRHLSEHALFYSQAIWLELDPMELSRALSNLTYKGEPLSTSIDPTPIALTGNYLGFKWLFSDTDGRTAAQAKDNWMRHNGLSLSDANADDTMIPLPTGGVFAEAVLGRSNAAEKLDLSRFWDWQESPIPILPPGINAINMRTPNAQATAPQTEALSAPSIQLQVPQALPNPTGMAAALSSLTAANMFRDMSGMQQTSALAAAALKTASAHAARAAELSGEGAQHAAEQAIEAMKAGMEHQRAMAKMAMEVAPMLAGPAGAGATLGKIGVSKAGALMNAASTLDAKSAQGESGGHAARSVLSSLIGMADGLMGRLRK